MSEWPKRRWFAFSLRTMFVVMSVFAIWFGWNVRCVRQRELAMQSGEPAIVGIGTYELNPGCRKLPYMWRWLGATPYYVIYLRPSATPEDIARWKAMFPDARIEIDDGNVLPAPN